MSAVPPCGIRNEQVAGATPATLTITGRQADISWLITSKEGCRIEIPLMPPNSRVRTTKTVDQQSKRKEPHEACSSISKQIALSPELQTESRPANPTDTAVEPGVPSGEPVRREAAINHRLVAQKQSTRLITGRRRSITCRDDQPSLAELRLGEPSPE